MADSASSSSSGSQAEATLASTVTCSSSSCPTILDKLRPPMLPEITRKRKVRVNNLPHDGARMKKKPRCLTDPKTVSVSDRAREFKHEMIVASGGKLFCSSCWEELSLKLSIIKNHIQSSKHECSKKKVSDGKSRERDISVALSAYEKEVHPSGETLPEAQKVYRVIVETFLKAGVPLSKIEDFRELLEENAYRLSDRRGLSDLDAFILGEKKQRTKAELQSKKVSVVFDGTTRLGEAFVIVLRFVDSFVIKQRLVCF